MLVFSSTSLSLDPLFLFVCPVGVTWCCCVNPCPFKVLVLPSRKMPLSMCLCTLWVPGSTTATTSLCFIITVRTKKCDEEKDNLPTGRRPSTPLGTPSHEWGGGRLLKANCHASQRLAQFLRGKVFKCCHFVTTSLSLVTSSSVVTPQHDSTHPPLSRAPRSRSCQFILFFSYL